MMGSFKEANNTQGQEGVKRGPEPPRETSPGPFKQPGWAWVEHGGCWSCSAKDPVYTLRL